MSGLLDLFLLLCAGVLLLPIGILLLEVLCALLPRRPVVTDATKPRPRCAVLVPAHDEELGIANTIATLKPQLQAGDRILVVADNCNDRTAEVARTEGATVVERQNAERRGKGYALDFGVSALEKDPPEVVVIVDADCRVHEGALDRLVRQVGMTGRPAQGVYVMADPPGADANQQLSAFAFLFKNQVRPLGLDRLGLPCLLTGSGMAFPYPALRAATLASGNIVEDMQMGVDLALSGSAAQLCPDAHVSSELPAGAKAAVAQRLRWEHGHIQTIRTQVPRLLLAGLIHTRLELLGLAAELCVPPLALLFLMVGVVGTLSLVSWLLGGIPVPFLLLLCGVLSVGGAVLAAWAMFARDRVPLTSLLAAPFYVIWKLPIYLALIFKPQRDWVRTERAAPQEKPAQ